MPNRFFFPQAAFDEWTVEEHIDVRGTELTLIKEARKYTVVEAVRVVSEVTGSPDAHDLVGRVKLRAALAESGAEVMENSMIVGDNAYDVVPGFVGEPLGDLEEFIRSSDWQTARFADDSIASRDPSTDEDLLEDFLRRTAS